MIQRLEPGDWQRLKVLRLAALQDAPDTFGSTLEYALKLEDADWEKGLQDLPTFVVSIGGIDQGLIRCVPDQDKPSSALIISMWVAPEFRRKGIGEKLIQAAVDWALSAGVKELALEVTNENASAIALYSRLGFEPTGETGSFSPPREHIADHRRVRKL